MTKLIWEECGPCPVFESDTLAFTLQLKKKHGKPHLGSSALSSGSLYALCQAVTKM
jgi:hypothetical protein